MRAQLSSLTSYTRFSQWVREVPSSPWSSSSAPSSSGHWKWSRASRTTRGVTIIRMSRGSAPPRTRHCGRRTVRITRSLHCRACSLTGYKQQTSYSEGRGPGNPSRTKAVWLGNQFFKFPLKMVQELETVTIREFPEGLFFFRVEYFAAFRGKLLD